MWLSYYHEDINLVPYILYRQPSHVDAHIFLDHRNLYIDFFVSHVHKYLILHILQRRKSRNVKKKIFSIIMYSWNIMYLYIEPFAAHEDKMHFRHMHDKTVSIN